MPNLHSPQKPVLNLSRLFLGKFYNQTRGYIKIRGDTCLGGKESIFEPLKVGCPVEEEKEFLLVAQRPNILRIDLRNLSNVDVLPLTQIKNVIALEFDLQENCVIYGDIELDKIFIQCLNGTPPRVLVENNLSVEGEMIFFDWRKAIFIIIQWGSE